MTYALLHCTAAFFLIADTLRHVDVRQYACLLPLLPATVSSRDAEQAAAATFRHSFIGMPFLFE
jgi:hypothetical protein